MSAEQPIVRVHGNAYNLFILLLTVFSLAVMVLLVLPLDQQTHQLLYFYDNAVCVDLPAGLRLQHHRLAAEAPVLHQPARLARPAGLDPGLRLLPAQRVAAARPPEPAGPDHAPAARQRAQGARPRHGREPRAVRDVHHDPRRGRPSSRVEHPRAPVRGPLARRQHRHRRRRAVVGIRHDHHGRLRRLLPGHEPRPDGWRAGHVQRRGDHRRAGQHPRESPRAAAEARRDAGAGAVRGARGHGCDPRRARASCGPKSRRSGRHWAFRGRTLRTRAIRPARCNSARLGEPEP